MTEESTGAVDNANVSLNDFFEGPDADISWHNVDDEFNAFAVQQLDEIDTLLFGRVSCELMASYWPEAVVPRDEWCASRVEVAR